MNILFRSDAGPIEGFTSTNFRVAISDDGVGELIGEPDVIDQIQGQVIVSVDGVDVFAWVLEDRTATSADNDEVVVSGRGNAARLERSIILPAGYPTFATRARSESGAPFAILATLIGEAQGRGRLAGLTPSWTSTLDSNGDPWQQNVTLSLEAGADLRALLDEVAEIEGAEWIVRPDGTFDAEREFGVDRSSEVVLFVGRDQLSRGRIESNREQRQTLYLSTSTGVSEVENPYVDDELGEVWVDGEDYRDAPTRDAVAQRLLESASLPQLEVEVVVTVDCGIFDAFNVGDLVSLDNGEGTLETVRVVGATVTVTDQVDVELTLVSEVKLRQRRIDEAIRARADVQPGVSAATQRRTGLTPADKLESGALQFDTTIQSANYEPDIAGWRIDGDGNAEFNDATFRGDLQSDDYVPNVSGWKLTRDGDAEFANIQLRDTATFVGEELQTIDNLRVSMEMSANSLTLGYLGPVDEPAGVLSAIIEVPNQTLPPVAFRGVTLSAAQGQRILVQRELVAVDSNNGNVVIASEANTGLTILSGSAIVSLDNHQFNGEVNVDGAAFFQGALSVTGTSQFNGQADFFNAATVQNGFSVVSGGATITGGLTVNGTLSGDAASFSGNLFVSGTSAFFDPASFFDGVDFFSPIDVRSSSRFRGSVRIQDGAAGSRYTFNTAGQGSQGGEPTLDTNIDQFGFVGIPSRRVFRVHAGAFLTSSESRLKGEMEEADLELCYATVRDMALTRYSLNRDRDDYYQAKGEWILDEREDFDDRGGPLRKLGIIAEEAPDEVADEGHLNIDVYSYASLIAGAVKALQNRIETLEADR